MSLGEMLTSWTGERGGATVKFMHRVTVTENKPRGENDYSLGSPLTDPSNPLVRVFTQVWYFISSSHVHLTKQTLSE